MLVAIGQMKLPEGFLHGLSHTTWELHTYVRNRGSNARASPMG